MISIMPPMSLKYMHIPPPCMPGSNSPRSAPLRALHRENSMSEIAPSEDGSSDTIGDTEQHQADEITTDTEADMANAVPDDEDSDAGGPSDNAEPEVFSTDGEFTRRQCALLRGGGGTRAHPDRAGHRMHRCREG